MQPEQDSEEEDGIWLITCYRENISLYVSHFNAIFYIYFNEFF